MLSVSKQYLSSVISDSRDMPYRVFLGGALELDRKKVTKMSLEESVSSGSGVALGTSNSATLKLTLKDAEAIEYNGMLVEPESGLVLPDGTIEYVPLGKFWVTNFSTKNDYKTLTLECADGMYHLTGEYISELTYPAPISSVMSEIVAQTGIEFVSELPDIMLRIKPEGLTHREAVGYLAGCCGKNARFNRLGQLEFVWYTDTGITIKRENQYMDGLEKLNDKPLTVNFEVTGQRETYLVTAVSDGNGGITATPGQKVYEGETVVLSINPFSGYELADITAVTEAGATVTLYRTSEGGCTFIQPDSNVTVTASFRKINASRFTVTVRSNGNGSINCGLSEAGTKDFPEGETVTIFAYPDDGYEVDNFATTPSGIVLTPAGTVTTGGFVYQFTMPKSDVTVTVNYKEAASSSHRINRLVAEGEHSDPGFVFIQEAYTGDYVWEATEGTIISVTFSENPGYEVDYYESSVELTQVGTKTYNFTMPDEEVSIVVHFKMYEDTTKAGLLEWLQPLANAPPPTNKPYWAIFYKEDRDIPVWQKFHLIWFDSWKATGYDVEDDKRIYNIVFDGYYYCGSQDVGDDLHKWNASTWSGNGASGATLSWGATVDGHPWSGDAIYSSNYSLLASNNNLFSASGSLIFKKCENAISTTQEIYMSQQGDRREWNSLTYYKCPDTFSIPAPATYWMIVEAGGSLCMTPDEDGKGYSSSDYCEGLYVLYFDSISIENIGKTFDNSDEEFYVATVTNGHYVALAEKTSDWGTLRDVADGDVIGLRSSLINSRETHDMLGRCYFAGILSSNCNVHFGYGLYHYKNDIRICTCDTDTTTKRATTFSLRRSINETVNVTYSNPLIYEKMVESISELVQGITYTPAKVKHRGNPAFQAGDVVSVPDKDGTVHTVLIMQQTMTFGGGMNSEISCPGQTEKTMQFSANGPMTAQIKKEVQKSNADLEHRLAVNNSLVYAAIYKTISSTESKISSIVEWQTEKSATIASLEQTADRNSAKIALVVGQNGIVNDDGAVQGSIVIEAINGESTAKISAKRLDIEGKTLNIKVDAANIEGVIQANQINANGITIGQGTIAGWTINQDYLGNDDTGIMANPTIQGNSLVNPYSTRNVRFYAGLRVGKTSRTSVTANLDVTSAGYFTGDIDLTFLAATDLEHEVLTMFYVRNDGTETSIYADLLDTSFANVDWSKYPYNIVIDRISATQLRVLGKFKDNRSGGSIRIQIGYNQSDPNFLVLDDGSMYARYCRCQGTFIGSDGVDIEEKISTLSERIKALEDKAGG